MKDLQHEISAELARCLDPVVHEQDIRPYGAIVCRELPHLEHLGRIIEDMSPKKTEPSLRGWRAIRR